MSQSISIYDSKVVKQRFLRRGLSLSMTTDSVKSLHTYLGASSSVERFRDNHGNPQAIYIAALRDVRWRFSIDEAHVIDLDVAFSMQVDNLIRRPRG